MACVFRLVYRNVHKSVCQVVTVIKRTKEVVNKAINWADFVDKMLILGNPDISASMETRLQTLMLGRDINIPCTCACIGACGDVHRCMYRC